MLNIDTNTAIRRPTDQQQLVIAVRDAAPEDESDWIEWKSFLDLASPEGRGAVARQVLALANRHPDRASTTAEGHGYLLVGVEPGNLAGLEEMDSADVDGWLRRYIGDDGPQWRASWPRVDGRSVLVIEVAPPNWGDPIHTLRRQIQGAPKKEGYPDGTVFIRRNAVSERSRSIDLQMLQQRARRQADLIRVTVGWIGESPTIPALDASAAAVDEWVEAERRELYAPLVTREQPKPRDARNGIDVSSLRGLSSKDLVELQQRSAAGEALTDEQKAQLEAAGARTRAAFDAISAIGSRMSFTREARSPEEYREEVEAYLDGARKALPQAVTVAMMARLDATFLMEVENLTDRNFRAVEVEVSINGPVIGLDEDDQDEDMPARPRLFGTSRSSPFPFVSSPPCLPSDVHRLSNAAYVERPAIIDNSGSTHVRFPEVDLRPRGRSQLDGVRVVARGGAVGSELTVGWRATARDADGIASGVLTAWVASTALRPLDLVPVRRPPTDGAGQFN